MRSLTALELAVVRGGTGKEIQEGRAAQGGMIGDRQTGPASSTDPVCYPEPNMSTPDGPVYTDGRR
jgi:hypothetical protein